MSQSDDDLDLNITRRDFLNATLIGAGAALLASKSPLEAAMSAPAKDDFTGPGGVGDYATSNGNTKPVLDAAHRMRDNAFASKRPVATGEVYDLIVVGGGITGLTAAYYFAKNTGGGRKCLVLENHPHARPHVGVVVHQQDPTRTCHGNLRGRGRESSTK